MSLDHHSIMLVGERYSNNLIWIQIYEDTHFLKSNVLKVLLRDIKVHILKNRIKPGSARKFKNGKLLFYEVQNKEMEKIPSKIYCLFSSNNKVGVQYKRALESVADRTSGYNIYSAKRFYQEMMDYVENPKTLDKIELSVEEVHERIDFYFTQSYDVNELAQVITFLTKSKELDWDTIEKIYVHVYSSIQSLLEGPSDIDPDEFLDAAYVVARAYEQIDKYRLGLELYKYLALVSAMHQRFNLETDCKLRIGMIYKKYFPPNGLDIIEALSTIADLHILESSKVQKEIYYSLMGYAYATEKDYKNATLFYRKAIDEAGVNISSPIWIAEAYNFMGFQAKNTYNLNEANRLYLTAAAIAFSDGDITSADFFSDNSSETGIITSNAYIKSAITSNIENNLEDTEYRTWIAMSHLIKSFIRATPTLRMLHINLANEILNDAEKLILFPGKRRKNQSFINQFRKFLDDLKMEKVDSRKINKKMNALQKTIEGNIVVPSPIFMLITLDGQLVMDGKIEDSTWTPSGIKGSILGGILVAIMSLIKEVSRETSLRTIDTGNFKIMIERSENGVVAFLLDRDISEYRMRLKKILNYIDLNCTEKLASWKGNKKDFYYLRNKIIEFTLGK